MHHWHQLWNGSHFAGEKQEIKPIRPPEEPFHGGWVHVDMSPGRSHKLRRATATATTQGLGEFSPLLHQAAANIVIQALPILVDVEVWLQVPKQTDQNLADAAVLWQ